jgi:Tfp pilus assembly protein PilF
LKLCNPPAAFLCILAVTVPAMAQSSRPALAELEHRAVTDSNDPVAQYKLGYEYWRKQHWDDAERAWRNALVLSPQYAEAYLGLAVLPMSRGEGYWRKQRRDHGQAAVDSVFAQAERYARRAFLNNPLVDMEILGEMKTPQLSVGNIRITYWWMDDFVKGVNDLRANRNDKAYQELEHLFLDRRADPRRIAVPDLILWYHGQAAARVGHLDQAVHDFGVLTGRSLAQEKTDAGLWLPSDTNEYRYLLAMMYYLSGRLTEAIGTFQRVLEFDIGIYQANIQLARIYEALGRWDQAIEQRRNAISVNPEDPSLLVDLGATLSRAGQWDEAQDVLRQAMEAAPRDPQAPFSLGLVALHRSDSTTARTAFRHFLSVAPSSYSQQISEASQHLNELGPRP